MFKKQSSALVQTRDGAQAQTAITFLNGVPFRGRQMRLQLSRHANVALPKADMVGWGGLQDHRDAS